MRHSNTVFYIVGIAAPVLATAKMITFRAMPRSFEFLYITGIVLSAIFVNFVQSGEEGLDL